MPEPPVLAGIYCRLSLAQYGDSTKVEDQERICRDLARSLGWEVTAVYADNNRSAWQKNRKRPAWDRMLADVGAWKINAIIVYHGDRLVRRPEDLTDLLRLADNKGVKLASPTGTHDLDSQRLELWIRAAFAEEESTRTSERKKSQYDRMRRAGLVRTGGRGGRAYGFARDGVTQMPEEVKAVREMARRVLDGEGTGAIAASLNARDLTTVTGGPWSHATIRKMLCRPRYAGLMPDGEHTAAWEPVLERDTWETVCALLHSRGAGYAYTTNARRYLLTGIALCGTCGHPLAIRHSTRSESLRGYGCINGECRRKLHRSVHYLDLAVTAWVLEQLSSPEFAETVARVPEPVAAAEIVALEKRKAEAEAALDSLADHPGLSVERAARAIASFDAKIAAVRERIAASPGRRLLARHTGISEEEWERLPLSSRRALVSAACHVTIWPSRRGPGFDPDSVDIRPRE